jgi:hypothetical protein
VIRTHTFSTHHYHHHQSHHHNHHHHHHNHHHRTTTTPPTHPPHPTPPLAERLQIPRPPQDERDRRRAPAIVALGRAGIPREIRDMIRRKSFQSGPPSSPRFALQWHLMGGFFYWDGPVSELIHRIYCVYHFLWSAAIEEGHLTGAIEDESDDGLDYDDPLTLAMHGQRPPPRAAPPPDAVTDGENMFPGWLPRRYT